MHSSEGKNRWVLRWRCQMAPTPRRGIWRLKTGGYFVTIRVTDPRTGKRYHHARAVRGANVTIERSGVNRRPAGFVKSGTKAVKRAVIASGSTRILKREGIRTLDVHLGRMSL